MKYLLYIAVSFLPVFANAQYRGGINDGLGTGNANLQNALPDIYSGGNSDGVAILSVLNQNPLTFIYSGGANDGTALVFATNENPLAGIYSGGPNDGVSVITALAQNTLYDIYVGGANDGVASVASSNQNALTDVYSGGPNDGTSVTTTAAQNPLATIYSGGPGDGYTIAFAVNQNAAIPLAVSLLAFTGEWFNDDAILAWQTTMEKDLDHFELERSADGGRTFSAIANISPDAGAAPHDYRYSDVRAYYIPGDYLLYRLKSLDTRGNFHYSAIVKLSKDKSQPVIVVYPNPSSGRFTLAIMNVDDVSGYTYVISGVDGKIIKRGTLQEASTSFDLVGYSSATYHLVLLKDGRPVQQFTILLIQ